MGKLVSVIMGIYNCQDTLAEALDCMVNQTYTEWEIVMCDDGSKDQTVAIAEEYVARYPDKMHLLKNEVNRGLNYTLNRCLAEAKGVYIARMDADDLCDPERFQKEVQILENDNQVHIVSSDMEFFDQEGVWGKTSVKKSPQKRDFLRSTPFCHAPCMVRKEAYEAVGGYSVADKLLRVEDYHLWVKMYEKGFRGVNIQKPLYSMRDDRNAFHRRKFKFRLNEAYVKAYAVKHLGLPVYGYVYCLRPIIVGLLPEWLYKRLHRAKK